MKLDELYRGSVYIDTNILYMYLRVDPAHLSAIKVFLSRIVRGQIEAFVCLGGQTFTVNRYRHCSSCVMGENG